ncbi:MAG: hypothetical protein ACKODH_15315 [Limisphaerales bacterium]
MKGVALALLTVVCALRAADAPKDLNLAALPKVDATQFVGAQKCATCHQSYFDGWKGTLHS